MSACQVCGKELVLGAPFCAHCGSRIVSAAPTAELSAGTSSEKRKEALRRHIEWLVGNGARIESQSDYAVQVVEGVRVNHLLHLLIGALTCGAWWLVWLYLGLFAGEKRSTITVDALGQVHYTGDIPPPGQNRLLYWLRNN